MKHLILAATIFLSPFFNLHAAKLTASVDKRTLTRDDFLTLTLTLTNSDIRLRAEGIDPNIDLTRLAREFDVGQPESHFRYRTERTHGRTTSTLKVPLFPRTTGRLRIPGFHLEGLSTRPIDIHVLPVPANPTPELFVKTGISQDSIWIKQSVEIYLDFYYRKAIRSAKLGGDLDAEPLQLLIQRLPDSSRTELYHGMSYQVIRRAWSVTPTMKQSYTFFVPDLWVETEDGEKRRFPVETLTLSVKATKTSTLLPVITDMPVINVEAPDSFAPGTPLSWRYVITARTHPANLPEVLALPETLGGARLFFSPPVKKVEYVNGVPVTQATYEVSMLPQSESDIRLPAVKLPYIDAASGKQLEILAQERTVRVNVDSNRPLPQDPVATAEKSSKLPQPAHTGSDNAPAWKITSMVMAILWLLTVSAWIRWEKKRSQDIHKPDHPHQSSNPTLQKLLKMLNSRTVEEGLFMLQKQGPIDADIVKHARNIQRACYSNLSVSPHELEKALAAFQDLLRKQQRPSREESWQHHLMREYQKQKTR
ncbi:MAG: hypothetical protein D6698_12890 [Gammaproteobacteria bacterium]|nr:MAG: hypothetical protein D6698_12890 [Gammaproteobacteria bacterium]